MSRQRFDQIPGLRPPKDEEAEQSFGDKAMRVLGMPGAATRAGIMAAQEGRDLLPAIREQLSMNAPEAPTGADIAQKVSDDTGITNPYGLAALATLADVTDPTILMPGGAPLKAAGMMGMAAKMAPKAAKAGKAAKPETLAQVAKRIGISLDDAKKFRADALAQRGASAKNTADALRKAPDSEFGKVVVRPTADEAAMDQFKKQALAKQAADAPAPKADVIDIRKTEAFKEALRKKGLPED